ncbi:MAG: hypothetical protein SOH80_08685 [Eubacteriales bacterium]
MKNKWQMKKATGDMKADGTMTVSEAWRQNKIRQEHAIWDDSVEQMKKDKNKDGGLDDILIKIQNGDSLTPDELSLLREKDPQLYQELQNRDRKEKAYKNQLSQAKTKEEFQRIRTMKSSELISRINFIRNDPAIPEGKKLEQYISINEEEKDAQKVEKEFIRSGAYDALPTEEEKREVERAEKEEKNPSETEETKESGKTEESEKTDEIEKTNEAEKTHETEKTNVTGKADADAATADQAGDSALKSDVSEKKTEQIMDRVTMEKEPTEEAKRKVHQSKLARKYRYHSSDNEPASSGVSFSADA